VVIGPKELPGVIRTVGLWVRRAKDLAREFQGGLEDIARETEIDKFKSELESELGDTNSIGQEISGALDPDGELAGAFDYDDSDWYSDHQDDAAEDAEDDEAAGPPMVEDLAETPESPGNIASDAPAETAADDVIETDAKTGA
jgi:sec-independent protein translocase protein TatB